MQGAVPGGGNATCSPQKPKYLHRSDGDSEASPELPLWDCLAAKGEGERGEELLCSTMAQLLEGQRRQLAHHMDRHFSDQKRMIERICHGQGHKTSPTQASVPSCSESSARPDVERFTKKMPSGRSPTADRSYAVARGSFDPDERQAPTSDICSGSAPGGFQTSLQQAEKQPTPPGVRLAGTVASGLTCYTQRMRETALSHVDPNMEFTEPKQAKKVPFWRYYLKGLTGSNNYDMVIFFLIFTNVLMVGIEVNHVAETRSDKTDPIFPILDGIYSVIFMLEVIVRALSDGSAFCRGSGKWWNIFDTSIVLISLGDAALSTFSTFSDTEQLGQMRTIRIIRIIRIVRTIRLLRLLKFIRALRLLLHSIIATLKSLIWAITLLLMIFWGFGIAFTQFASDYIINNLESYSGPDSDTTFSALERFWGTLPKSMYTLFKAVTGGITWDEVVTPIANVSVLGMMLFNLYIVFTFFAVLNVITGIFCQSALESAYQEKEVVTMNNIVKKKEFINDVTNLFHEINADGTGRINISEFEWYMNHEKCQAYMDSLGIEVDDAWLLFTLLDIDGGGTVDKDEFINGFINLRGPARALQMARMEQETTQLKQQLVVALDVIEGYLQAIALQAGIDPVSSALPIAATNNDKELNENSNALSNARDPYPRIGIAPNGGLVGTSL